MALKAPAGNKNGKKAPPIESGTYPARLVQVITLGLQPQRPFKGEEKPPAYELYTTYEFADEFLKDEDGNDILDKPRWLSETFPFYSLGSDRAKSTQRYTALDPSHKYEGDWEQLLGAPVMITVTQDKSAKDNNIYNNISHTANMREKDAGKLPALVNPPKLFDLSNPDLTIFLSLPEWLQDKIKANLEYPGSALERALQAHKANPGSGDAKKEEGPSESDSGPSRDKDEEEGEW